MTRPGIVIVAYNSEGTIGACLDSVAGSGADVVVVDNASDDGTRAEVMRRPGVRLIANPWNRGFAAAANQGIDAIGSEHVLLLNPDAELEAGIDLLSRCCEAAGVAAAGGKLVDSEGRPQAGFAIRRLPSMSALAFEVLGINRLWRDNPVNRRYRCAGFDFEKPAEVEQPAGAFLMLRRDVWRKLGGFDERFYPLWFEDVDFCRRALGAGYRVLYQPGAAARHRGGHSAGLLDWDRRESHWYANLLTYAAKHFRRSELLALCAALFLGSCLRTVWGILRSRSLKPFSVYARVIRLAGLSVVSGRNEEPSLSPAYSGPLGSANQFQ